MENFDTVKNKVNEILANNHFDVWYTLPEPASLEDAQSIMRGLLQKQAAENYLLHYQTVLINMKTKLQNLVEKLNKCLQDYTKIKDKSVYENEMNECGLFKNVDRMKNLLNGTFESIDKMKNSELPNLINLCNTMMNECDSLIEKIKSFVQTLNSRIQYIQRYIDYYRSQRNSN